MAQSRFHKVGSIYSRMKMLFKGQGLPEEDLPIWFNIYKNFPPIEEPIFNRPIRDNPIKAIFYKEDVIRAKFQKEYIEACQSSIPTSNPSLTQQFLQIYTTNEKKGLSESEAYDEAVKSIGQKFTLTKHGSKPIRIASKTIVPDSEESPTMKINLQDIINSKE